jgi:predicted nucleic acid-binding protein
LYLDANILIYAALDTTDRGENASALLKMLKARTVSISISPLVVDEVLWGIQKVSGKESASRFGELLLSMPFTWLDLSQSSVKPAIEYYKRGLGPRDAFHAAVMKDYGINEILSEDAHFDRIKDIRRISIKDALKGR